MILNVVSTSQLKYKETYEKQKGHYLAGKEISEFPGVVHCLDFQKMRSVVSEAHFHRGFVPLSVLLVCLSVTCSLVEKGMESFLRFIPTPAS